MQEVRSRWPSSVMLRGIILFFAVLIALRFAWMVRSVLIIAFAATLFGVVLTPVVDRLERLHVKRGLGAVLVVTLVLALLGGTGALMAPMLREQTADLKERLPAAVDKIEEWLNRPAVKSLLPAEAATQAPTPAPQEARPPESPGATQSEPAAQQLQGGAESTSPQREGTPQAQQGTTPPGDKPPQQSGAGSEGGAVSSLRAVAAKQLGGIVGYLFPFVSSTVAAIGGILLVLVLAIYIASDPRLYRLGLLHLVPHAQRDRAREVMSETGDALRQWMVARLLAMVAVGVITAIAMLLLGVKAWAALGLIAGLLEFIPFFGPVIAAVPALAVALVDSPQKALMVALAFVVIQQIEGNVITPLLLKQRVDVPPALTIIAVSALGIVFGFLGLLIAEPLLVAVLVFVKLLYVGDVVGDEV